MSKDMLFVGEATVEIAPPVTSLRTITALSEGERDEWVRRFLPERLLKRFQIDRQTFCNRQGERVIEHSGSPDTGEVRVAI